MKDSIRDIINDYWNRATKSPELMGVYPMGTGCEIEVPYRHYGELQSLLPHLPTQKFSLLELACGAGRWAFSLAPRLTSYVGVDISAPQIQVAREKAHAEHLHAFEFHIGDALAFDAPPASFDVIFLGSMCMYTDDAALHDLLDKARAWLKPGGLLVEHITTIVGEATYVRQDANYFAIYRTPEEFTRLVGSHGFAFNGDVRSYSFLRGARSMWNIPELQLFVRWGMEHEPQKTFELMKAWSDAISTQQGPYIYEREKTYDHRFFVFTVPA